VLATAALVGVPSKMPGVLLAAMVGGAWLTVVLAMTLPTDAARTAAEHARRLTLFRHQLNTVGDHPDRKTLDALVVLARELELRDDEIAAELAQLQASLQALDLAERLRRREVPIVDCADPLAPGERCHLIAPVQHGRRRSDHCGRMLLTSDGLKFRGPRDASVAWTDVASVLRAGRELIVTLHQARPLRFSFHTLHEAASAGVLAEHLAAHACGAARPDGPTT
jgi:hypothetical protein